MTNNLVLTSKQQAMALLALRQDAIRQLKAELEELKNDEEIIVKYIESCYDKQQGRLFQD